MNLLCPNCQKMLTVPEQYAGQLMKCPLCAGTFTVPTLPGSPTAEAPPPPPPPAPVTTEPTASPPPAGSNFQPPAPTTGTSSAPVPTGDYRANHAMYFSPKVLPWIVAVSLVLVFVLQFFPWVGIYPGGVPAVTQNAWGAAFGSWEPDPDLKGYIDKDLPEKDRPGANVLTIFYLLLFIPTLIVTIGVLLLGMGVIPVPAALQNIMPWRWGIVAGLNLLLVFFLLLQLLLGFSIESRWKDSANKNVEKLSSLKTDQQKLAQMGRGMMVDALDRTAALWLAFLLQLVALACAALAYWVNRRPAGAPIPRLALQY
jgi:hypothetical protein